VSTLIGDIARFAFIYLSGKNRKKAGAAIAAPAQCTVLNYLA
jgi:hypothetical protein